HLPSGEMEHLRTPDNQLPNADQGSMIFWHEDSNGNIFLTPHGGTFCRYNPESRKLELLQSESDEPYCRSTRRYCVDKQENIWIAETIGATCLTPYRQTPKPIAITESDTKALLIDRHDRIWMTSRDHTICLFDQQERLLGYLGRDGRLHRERTLFDAAIYCLHEDEDGTIWMGSLNNGLFRLTETSPQHYHIDQFTHDPHDTYSLSHNRIYDICRDHRGRLWIGSYNGGLNLVEGEKGDRPRFFHDLNRLRYPQPVFDQIRTFEEIGDWLFIGTTRGLVIYSTDFDEPEQATYYTYQTSALEGNSFPSNDIHDIHYTSSGEIYLLAFSGGLSRVIPEKSTPEHLFCETLTSKDGLPSEQVLAMIEEPNTGAQWLETETGLFRFDSSKRRVESFATQYRSQDYIFSEAKPLLRNNQMYVGTTNGLYSIPIDAQDSHFIPPLRLTEIRIKGEVRTCGVDQLRHIDLQSDERNLYLAFAALDYTNPSAIHYAYRIRNVKESWNEVSDWQMLKSQNYVHFMHLEPGDYAIEIRSTNSEGQWIDDTLSLSLSVAPTFWETGWAWLFYAVILLLVILIPVTILYLRGKIAMEQRLSATKLRFYTNISHELRTPLTLITAPIDLLLRREQLTEEGRRELAIVRRNTQRLIHTINQILDFRKIENLKMRLLLEQGDLLPLVRHAMSHFDLQAEEHRIDYRLRCDEEQLQGWFDRDKLEKILFNLLSNAFKYTPDGRSIQVCLATRQGVLQLQVIDQGEGMDEVTKKRIFARFETLMRANLFKPSSGIGLSLVHELTLLHGGSIEVDSEVGRGSCFTVTLPINQEAFAAMNHVDFLMDDQTASAVSNDLPAATTLSELETATPQQDNTPHTEEASERWSILLVEDNDELRTMMRNILSAEYTVFEAADGEEGLAIAREQLPHMVISDIMMPRMDGLEMVRKIKEDNNTSHALILLLSAKSSLDDRIQGLEQGVDDYIPKPFHASYLLARIHSLIARRQELQQQLLAQMVAVDITQTNTEEYVTPELLFMRKATAVIEAHLDNCEWSIDDFASEMCLSSPALYRKLRAVVDLSPVEFVREVRLKKACQLIRERHHSIAAISDMVGFSDPKYFTRVFKKRFGIPPSQYHETLTLPEGVSEPQ
ncbi:MAG: response regulator, partial [Alistipes sp.]|nr:response regulator [Alistipes sp.]